MVFSDYGSGSKYVDLIDSYNTDDLRWQSDDCTEISFNPNVVYGFSVSARNQIGGSELSETFFSRAVTTDRPMIPVIAANESDYRSITLNWTSVVSDDQDQLPDDYIVLTRTSVEDDFQILKTDI